MRTTKLAAMAAAIAVSALAAGTADAASCKARVSGTGTGQGLAGIGSDNAKTAATVDWQANVRKRFGHRFANVGKAQGVKMDCAAGAILQAKCVMTARPCR